MDAGLVLLELIDALLRRVLAHLIGAAVAARTGFRDVGARGLAHEAFGLVHGDSGSSVVRSPPWQSAQPSPWVMWMSFVNEGGGTFGGPSSAAWHSTQESAARPARYRCQRRSTRSRRIADALICKYPKQSEREAR